MAVKRPERRRRVKLGTTIDRELAAALDAYLAAHPGFDRSDVIDDALRLWYARIQESEMEAQFSARPSVKERAERAAWRAVQTGSAKRIFRRR